jgi:hypothetical protein
LGEGVAFASPSLLLAKKEMQKIMNYKLLPLLCISLFYREKPHS